MARKKDLNHSQSHWLRYKCVYWLNQGPSDTVEQMEIPFEGSIEKTLASSPIL